MPSSLQLLALLLGALSLIASCCTAFVPHHHSSRAWSAPRHASFRASRLYVSPSSHQVTSSNSTFFTYHDNHATENEVSPKDFFQLQGQGAEQLQQLQALEKLVQSHTELSAPTHIVDQETITTTTLQEEEEQEETSFLSTVWNARLLLLGAAALYGTNFSVIKILGDVMPVGITATLRFGLAALATIPWLLQPPKDGSKLLEESKPRRNLWETCQHLASTTTVGAALAGFEVGAWNSVGYLAQAVGLETTDASKVCLSDDCV